MLNAYEGVLGVLLHPRLVCISKFYLTNISLAHHTHILKEKPKKKNTSSFSHRKAQVVFKHTCQQYTLMQTHTPYTNVWRD